MSEHDHDRTPTSQDRAYAQRLFGRVDGDPRARLAAELIGAHLAELHPCNQDDARITRRARAYYDAARGES